jgi:hypothetical protein
MKKFQKILKKGIVWHYFKNTSCILEGIQNRVILRFILIYGAFKGRHGVTATHWECRRKGIVLKTSVFCSRPTLPK